MHKAALLFLKDRLRYIKILGTFFSKNWFQSSTAKPVQALHYLELGQNFYGKKNQAKRENYRLSKP